MEIIGLVLLVVGIVYAIINYIKDKDREAEMLRLAKERYGYAESDVEIAVEKVASDVDFLSTSGTKRTVRSQSTPSVFTKNGKALYAFEVTLKNHRTLDKGDLEDFKIRLQRALISMRPQGEYKSHSHLEFMNVNGHGSYLEIIVDPHIKK